MSSYAYIKLRESTVVSEPTRRVMRANRATKTAPEVRLGKALWASGIRGYRKNVRKVPGTPDFLFGKQRVVVFVHGCYWHSCQKCMAGRIPKTNPIYWTEKLKRNRERDEANRTKLEAMGYRVLIVWECELKVDVEGAVERVQQALSGTNR